LRIALIFGLLFTCTGCATLDLAAGHGPCPTSIRVKGKRACVTITRSWYAVQLRAQGTGFTIVPISAKRHVGGDPESRPQPATIYFQFAPDAAFYRLFYKGGNTNFTALAVAASTCAQLDRRTGALDANTASCEMLNRELCIEILGGEIISWNRS
jgi:hypothetical protein